MSLLFMGWDRQLQRREWFEYFRLVTCLSASVVCTFWLGVAGLACSSLIVCVENVFAISRFLLLSSLSVADLLA